ncbi:MAG: cytochrome C oxidase subunit IV family protein [Verrucomicrobiota bacterium]
MSEEVTHTEHDDSHEIEHLKSHIKFYWIIFWALIVGTILTVGVPYLIHFENHTYNVILGLAIATVKATLVSLFFMHLSAEKKLIYGMIALAVFGAIALFILTALAYWDHSLSYYW